MLRITRLCREKVNCFLSGGIDSAVSCAVLKELNFDVQPVFVKNWSVLEETGICQADEDLKSAKKVVEVLGVENKIEVIDAVKPYWNDVFEPFTSAAKMGHSLNPDILCNERIKFDVWRNILALRGLQGICATGHYLLNQKYDVRYDINLNPSLTSSGDSIEKADDENKCQLWFLSRVKPEILKNTIFPLALVFSNPKLYFNYFF